MNQSQFDYLRSKGFTGDLNDMLVAFYKSQGAVGSELKDLEYSFLASLGFSTGAVQDRWRAYLTSIGYTGALQDALVAAWKAGAFPVALLTDGTQGWWYDPSDLTPAKTTWRRNLFTYTEQFDNAAWLKANVSVQANASTAPDGTNTADKLVVDVSPGAAKSIRQEVSYGTWTVTVYAKPAGYSGFFISFGLGGTFFNLSNGTVREYYTAVPTASSIIPAGNGWYKCSITITAGGNCYFGPNDNIANDLGASFSGDGVSGVYVWGAQIEAGSTSTAYQKITDFYTEFLAAFPSHTLFQDAAGTIPVTAVEQPVGLMLDKSGQGNHATQATSTSRPILRNRYNMIACSTGAATSWQQYNAAVITPNYTIGPDGLEPAARVLTGSGLTGTVRIPTSQGVRTATQYHVAVAIKSNTASSYDLALQVGDGDVLTAHVTPEWTVFSGVGSPAADGYNFIDLDSIPSNSDISVCQVSVVPTADAALPYQRVNTATDYDSDASKFPLYLDADGSDDGMATAAFAAGSDKVTVFAAVHKRSDATIGMIYEFSADMGANNGAFQLYTNSSPHLGYDFASRGTTSSLTRVTSLVAPKTSVLSLQAVIGADVCVARVDGLQVASSSADQGTGDFGTHQLYLFRRGGASLPFDGRFYGGAGKFRTLSSTEIATIEQYLRMKSKADYDADLSVLLTEDGNYIITETSEIIILE